MQEFREKLAGIWRAMSLPLCVAIGVLLLCGCRTPSQDAPVPVRTATPPTPKQPTPEQMFADKLSRSLQAATRYLIKAQSSDGAWRSKHYGYLKDGPSLSPLVMRALLEQGEPSLGQGESSALSPEAQKAWAMGKQYLIGLVDKNGRVRIGQGALDILVVPAAAACRVLASQPDAASQKAKAAWLGYVQSRRLSSQLGWKPDDAQFGGWSFSIRLPRKPPPRQIHDPYAASNLMATSFGIEALRATGTPPDAPLWKEVSTIVFRCQNFADVKSDADARKADARNSDARFDDGGCFQIPGGAADNKAGVAGSDSRGRERYHSYGSMTADGLRSLLGCGLPSSHPRVQAARMWLENHWSVAHNPGDFPPDREVLRGATYFYYCQALARTLADLKLREVRTPKGKILWARALGAELLKRQRRDGSWVNRFSDSKEDDPLIATMWAATALALCQRDLATP
jgi:squalene-hopene/tetraprenyl-beta-curcumene cyclase